jgi:hypothetical protein
MAFHFFSIPTSHGEAARDELNALLALGHIGHVKSQFVADGTASFWAFCIEVVHNADTLPDSHKRVALLSDEEGRKFMGSDFASCLYDEPQGPRGAGRALLDDSEPNVLRVTRSAEFSFFSNE